ncbi:MAG: helix-turn-helix domain-containing protein [Acetatifactor sp.]
MDKVELGKRLVALRAEHNMSQKELAEQLCISPSALCKWEHGNSAPDIEAIKRLTDIFQLFYDELLAGESLTTKAVKKPQKWVWIISALTLFAMLAVVGSCIFFPSQSRFTVIDTRYDYEGFYGVEYCMAVVSDAYRNETDRLGFEEKVLQDWKNDKLGTEAEVITIYYYDLASQAQQWDVPQFITSLLGE